MNETGDVAAGSRRPVLAGAPKTVVGVSQTEPDAWSSHFLEQRELHPRIAAVLAAVLSAAAEQVSADKLKRFRVDDPHDLDLLSLAMAFRGQDSGLLGDVFEWTVLSAVNLGAPDVCEMAVDALRRVGVRVDEPRAILAAAEKGRGVAYLPSLPSSAVLQTGKPGRPPSVKRILEQANVNTWKGDILLGEDSRWVSATLKVKPSAMARHGQTLASTAYPPRIGIMPVYPSNAGVVTDEKSGLVLMKVPVSATLMSIANGVLRDVKDAFDQHLAISSTPLAAQDLSGVAQQLHQWKDRSVREAIERCQYAAGDFRLFASEAEDTLSDAIDPADALVAVNVMASASTPNPALVRPAIHGGYRSASRDFVVGD